MGIGIIKLIIGAIKPLAELRKHRKNAEKGGEGTLQNTDIATTIIKTIGFWVVLAMLLYAMSKGILSLSDVEGVIETIKE